MKMRNDREHIHTPDDGRPFRMVLLNGKRVRHVEFCDTRKGKVVMVDDPPKADKYKKRIIRRTKYGKVEVLPIEH